MNFWDVGGQKTIRGFWRNYFDTTDGLVWVVDSSDIHRLQDCRMELHSLLKEERLCGVSLLILANKQDLPRALSTKDIGEFLGLDEIKKHRRCAVIGCSARDSISVNESIHWIIDDVGDRIYTIR